LPRVGKKTEEGVTANVSTPDDHVDLAAITRAASREAGGVPPDLLGDFLPAVHAAALTGRRLMAAELTGHGRSGERAAESGVALRGLVDLYLSAAWRLWRELPDPGGAVATRAAGLAVLRAADDAVAAAAEGFERAHLSVARRQEADRIEFLDDLLGGRGSLPELVARGAGFGLRLAGPHQVVLVAGSAGARYGGPQGLAVERLVANAVAPAPSLAMARGGRLVAVIGVTDGNEAARLADALASELSQGADDAGGDVAAAAGGDGGAAGAEAGLDGGEPGRPGPAGRAWRVSTGRAYAGPVGVLRSYDEAMDALDVAERLHLADPVVNAADLLMYRVILRDRAALADLVGALLMPLSESRDGAGPLLDTLEAYFASGQVAVQAARRLHLSVRAVTYRLARVRDLTGQDPARPADALALQVAVIGARLLDWPATPLEADPR
jgi:PucR C-terminal helix-turn-helix domain/GGDEF-like domain